jgi:class 3 adenylate cyclase
MIDPPDTYYAKTADGTHIAYQLLGDAPPDVLYFPIGQGHLEMVWEVPAFANAFRRLATFSRLIRFDYAGTGISDPLTRADPPSLERRAEEILAVLDAISSERVALLANNVGGLQAIYFAATYPERVASLILDGCYARLARAADYPWGIPQQVLDQAIARVRDRTGDPVDYTGMRFIAPHAAQKAEFLEPYRRYHRSTIGPGVVHAESELAAYGDLRALLPSVQAPTLVLYRSGDMLAGKPHATYLAEHIPDARLVEVPGDDNFMFVGNDDVDLDEIEEFLTGTRHVPTTDRVLATVLFTDIVGSTERASALGDRKWRELIDSHDRAVRRQLDRFRGREVHTTGDGFLSTFDGPGRAIECACAIRAAVRAIGLEVRAGLHTGEIEVLGGDVAGIAVHIGARISALADAGEVLVSSTVKDLVVGSGLEFEDRGEHELRGVPGTWRVFRVESSS